MSICNLGDTLVQFTIYIFGSTRKYHLHYCRESIEVELNDIYSEVHFLIYTKKKALKIKEYL